MALSVSRLIDNLLALPPTSDVVSAAQAMADAYADYCSGATTPAGGGLGPASVEPGKAAVAAALQSLFAQGAGTPASSGPQMAAAFAAFWPVTTFLFSAPAVGPGITAPPTGTSVLGNFIASMLPVSDSNLAISSLSTAIDTMCRTVLVTFPGPVNPIISPVV